MAAVPKMSRHDMKQDDLTTAIEKVSDYVKKNPVSVRNAGLIAAGVIALGALAYWFFSSGTAAAHAALIEAQARFEAPVLPPGVAQLGAGPTYPTEAERDRAALEAFNKVVDSYGGRAEGRLARYYQGVLLNRAGKYAEAEAALKRFVDSSPSPALAGTARAQLASARAAQGDLDGAAKILSELAENKESGYPRDFALYDLASTLARQGKTAEAAEAYKKIVAEFPNTPLAAEAQGHLK